MGMVGFFHEDQHFWALYNYESEMALEEHRKPTLPYNTRVPALVYEELVGEVLIAPESEWNDNLYHQYLAKLELEEAHNLEHGSSTRKHYRRLFPPLLEDDDF